jgi:hypothetical protein
LVAIELDEESLQRAALERLGLELKLPRDGATNFLIARPERLALNRLIQRSMRQPEMSASMIAPITGAIAELLAHAQTGKMANLAHRWRKRQPLLSKAEHFLRLNADQPFDSRALAAALGTTERSIQMSCNQICIQGAKSSGQALSVPDR